MASKPPREAQPMLGIPARSPRTSGVQRATAAGRPRNQSIWRSRTAVRVRRRRQGWIGDGILQLHHQESSIRQVGGMEGSVLSWVQLPLVCLQWVFAPGGMASIKLKARLGPVFAGGRLVLGVQRSYNRWA